MLAGDGVDMDDHLRKKWCTGFFVVVLETGLDLRIVNPPNLTYATMIPLMGWGFVDYFGRY